MFKNKVFLGVGTYAVMRDYGAHMMKADKFKRRKVRFHSVRSINQKVYALTRTNGIKKPEQSRRTKMGMVLSM